MVGFRTGTSVAFGRWSDGRKVELWFSGAGGDGERRGAGVTCCVRTGSPIRKRHT